MMQFTFSVADKWLDGGITKIGDDQYVSNNSPYNKQWGQTQWHYSGKFSFHYDCGVHNVNRSLSNKLFSKRKSRTR